jgi:CheY-like chemotaxis protein
MSRILLVDDSPHAQRMGERILSDEGYEVVTVSNADSALIRLEDVDPDVVLADAVMPGRTGYDICHYLRMSPRHRHVRVILTSGAQEPIDEARAQLVQADGALQKPFEASVLLAAVKPLAEAAAAARGPGARGQGAEAKGQGATALAAPFVAVVDGEQVRAAVTLALDAAMGSMIDEIARRVLAALQVSKPVAQPAAEPPNPEPPQPPQPALPPAPHTARGLVRRVSPLRVRTGSILGLDIDNLEQEDSAPGPRPPAPGPH